jgi:hypothetical protein
MVKRVLKPTGGMGWLAMVFVGFLAFLALSIIRFIGIKISTIKPNNEITNAPQEVSMDKSTATASTTRTLIGSFFETGWAMGVSGIISYSLSA